MSSTRILVLDQQTAQLDKIKRETILALKAYCDSRWYPKVTHYKLAQELIAKIPGLVDQTALANALYANYVAVSNLKSQKLAKALALLLGKIHNVPRGQINAYQSFVNNPTTLVHCTNFLRVFPGIDIGMPSSFAEPLSDGKRIPESELPRLLDTMHKMTHTRDECSAKSRETSSFNEVAISLSRTYLNNKRAVLYVIYDNIKIANPVAAAHANSLRPEQVVTLRLKA
jgi:hypothetical protein